MSINFKALVQNLSPEQRKDLLKELQTTITPSQTAPTSCPNCGSVNHVKNGILKNKQRYLCRDCKKTFGQSTKTTLHSTKLSNEQWQTYIKCMLNGKSIRKSAETIGVCVKTSFYVRHKILNALNATMPKDTVSGVVEMDETFVAESFKGNHAKSGFEMPRPSRKRGKQIKKRGISREQICIGTAIDKNNNVIMKMTNKGRISSRILSRLFTGYVGEGAIVCSDSCNSYKTICKNMGFEHRRIPPGKHANGEYNLSAVNSLHSRFKTWMRKFNGVSTKYLSNYLVWFKWLESNKMLQDVERPAKMWNDVMAELVDVRICTIRQREVAWV